MLSRFKGYKFKDYKKALVRWLKTPFYRGDACECPVCGAGLRHYYPIYKSFPRKLRETGFIYGLERFETMNFAEYSCPSCDASDRERLYALYLRGRLAAATAGERRRFIDFAPSLALSRLLRTAPGLDYRTADYFRPNVDDQVDISNMPLYADNSVDLFMCSHILEHVPDDQAAIVPLIQQHGMSPDRPLSSLLTAEEMTALNAAAAAAGMPAGQIDVLRPWFAGLALSMAPLIKAGYDPQSGVELVLKARAEAAGKPIQGLETIDKQIGILAGMPEADQLSFLRSLLESWEDATVELDRMVGAWASGDVASLEEIAIDEMLSETPELYEALLVRRNTDWANQIETMLEGSGTVFIAVGAAHLAGDDSVQEILGDRGVTVSRE